MYVYTIYSIWNFEGEVAQVREPVNLQAFTNFDECRKALIDYLSKYTTSRFYKIEEVKTGNYNRKELLEMKCQNMISGYAIYDLVNFHKGRETTRYLINRYRLN